MADSDANGILETISNLIPPEWLTTDGEGTVRMSVYRTIRIQVEELQSDRVIVDLGNVRAVITFSRIPYFEITNEKLWIEEGKEHLSFKFASRKNILESDTYLVLLAPLTINGEMREERVVREDVRVAVGLLATFNGRNIVYQHMFDNVVQLPSHNRRAESSMLTSPFSAHKPDIGDTKISQIGGAYKMIQELGEKERNRVRLSLQWYESALYDFGVDSYLKYWIALETLGMPNTSNIKPLHAALGRAYEMTDNEARDRFQIGRLHGLRSAIVHAGAAKPIDIRLLRYVEALYVDILFEYLGLEFERRAESVLNEPDFDLKQFLG